MNFEFWKPGSVLNQLCDLGKFPELSFGFLACSLYPVTLLGYLTEMTYVECLAYHQADTIYQNRQNSGNDSLMPSISTGKSPALLTALGVHTGKVRWSKKYMSPRAQTSRSDSTTEDIRQWRFQNSRCDRENSVYDEGPTSQS